MTNDVAKVSLTSFMLMTLISSMLGCVPGCFVGWFICMAVTAIPSLFVKSKNYRIMGAIACFLALSAAAIDYEAGRKRAVLMEIKMERINEQLVKSSNSGISKTPEFRDQAAE